MSSHIILPLHATYTMNSKLQTTDHSTTKSSVCKDVSSTPDIEHEMLHDCFSIVRDNLPEDEMELLQAKMAILVDEVFSQKTGVLSNVFINKMQCNEQDIIAMTDREIWEKIKILISEIETGYLDSFINALSTMSGLLESFNSMVYANYASWVSSGKKENELVFEGGKACKMLQDFLDKYSETKNFSVDGETIKIMNADGIIFPHTSPFEGESMADLINWTNTVGTSKEDAQKWAKNLGLPESCVKPVVPCTSADNRYVVVINLSYEENMLAALIKNGWTADETKITSMAYQAFNAYFTAQFASRKSNVETLTEQNRNAKATFDNVSNILSGTIAACFDAAKSFLVI